MMRKSSAGLFIIPVIGVLVIVAGCRQPKTSKPPVVRITDISGWSSSYSVQAVEEELGGRWKEVEGHPGVFRADLGERVDLSGETPDISAVSNGKQFKLGIPASLDDLKPDEFAVTPGTGMERGLSSSLLNNGAVTREILLSEGPVTITVTAKGKLPFGEPSHMVFHFNGRRIADFNVPNTDFEPYTAVAEAKDATNVLAVEFDNDYWKPPMDRNLYLDQIRCRQPSAVFTSAPNPDAGPPSDFTLRYRPLTRIVEQYRKVEPIRRPAGDGEDWRYYTVGKDTRPGIPLPAPGELTLNLPKDCEDVVVGAGLVPGGPTWSNETNVFEFTILRDNTTLDSRTLRLAPRRVEAHRSWIETRLRVRGPGDAPVRLVVASRIEDSTGAEDGTHNASLVSQPIMLRAEQDPSKNKNVILVSLDTLRGDRLGCLGYGRDTSPNLDRFAGENFNFTNAIAQASWTLPSHVTMFTSLYPSTHGVQTEDASVKNAESITGIIRKSSRRTKGIADGGFLSPEFGFCEGFDSYENHNHVGFAGVMPSAEKWLRDNGTHPFFLFLHTYDVHTPYSPPEEYQSLYPPADGVSSELLKGIPVEFVSARRTRKGAAENPLSAPDLQQTINMYDAGITYVDDQLQILFDLLRELDLWDNTMIVVVSDHGERFMEHGLLDHGNCLYEEVVHVPLLIRAPNLKGESRIVSVVEVVDIAPTILDWLGLPAPRIAQGDSLLPFLQGTKSVNRPAFSEEENRIACRTAEYKFINWLGEKGGTELYNLVEDPTEQKNVSGAQQELVSKMKETVGHFREQNEEIGREITNESVDLSGEVKGELQNLGYFGGD